MASLKLLIEEIRYRKINFVLSLFAVTIAAMLVVAWPTLIDSYSRQTEADMRKLEDETRKLMVEMGFNLMIVHRDTNMSDMWASDFAAHDMPQEYVQRLANARELTLVTHLVATLQQRIDWKNQPVLLVGYLPEVTQSHIAKKKPMGFDIEPGSVYLGHLLARELAEGDAIEVLGKQFRVARILEERGSKEDIMMAMNLADAQEILNKPGSVNQIMALGCRCAEERLPIIRQQLGAVLPETKITEFRSKALARDKQRELVERARLERQARLEHWAGLTTPLVVLVCGVWVGLLTLSNVRERRWEIGLLRALGKGSVSIATLLLGKAMLLGLLGAFLGFGLGTWLASALGQQFEVTAQFFTPAYDLLAWTVIGAPLICVMASYLPTLVAVLQDPAVVLRDA